MDLHRCHVVVDDVARDVSFRLFVVTLTTVDTVCGEYHILRAGALSLMAAVAAVVRAVVNGFWRWDWDADFFGVQLEALEAAALVVALLVDAILQL